MDVVGIVAVICVIGLPMIGLVLRFALRPLVQDLTSALRDDARRQLADVRERVAALEDRLETQEETLDRFLEAERFRRELDSGSSPGG